MVADGKTLQIPQALATTQDSQHRHQEQIPGRDAHPAPHPRVRDRLEGADQVEIGCDRSAFGHKEEAIPPTSTHADSPARAPVPDFESALLRAQVFLKHLKEFLDNSRLAQSLSEEGDCGGIWNVVHHAKPDKLLKGASVIHLEFKLVNAEVEKLLENEHFEKD